MLVAVAVMVSGCGGERDADELTVSAAASLREAFSEYAAGFRGARVRSSFGGSAELAAQIRQGVRPDVYAAANTDLPAELYREGLVEKPVVFASNRLAVAVPKGSAIDSLDDLARPGTKVAIGSDSVPAGRYARTVIGRLEDGTRDAIVRNVRAEEPDVKGVVGKVAQGAVDAGLVYVTDVAAADGRVDAVEIPADLQPEVAYSAAVVKGAKHPGDARRFVDGLTRGQGEQLLSDAGFEEPR